MWIPETKLKLRSSGLTASTFTPWAIILALPICLNVLWFITFFVPLLLKCHEMHHIGTLDLESSGSILLSLVAHIWLQNKLSLIIFEVPSCVFFIYTQLLSISKAASLIPMHTYKWSHVIMSTKTTSCKHKSTSEYLPERCLCSGIMGMRNNEP